MGQTDKVAKASTNQFRNWLRKIDDQFFGVYAGYLILRETGSTFYRGLAATSAFLVLLFITALLCSLISLVSTNISQFCPIFIFYLGFLVLQIIALVATTRVPK